MGRIESDKELREARQALKTTMEQTGWSEWRIMNYAKSIHDQHMTEWEFSEAIYALRDLIIAGVPRIDGEFTGDLL